ncbi:MAG TPA: hypothetical protein PLQ97_13060 [Myxococcota bacterium]|mgnify:FL=1|nr:hypothetical protein [Myxococcota bacterium]HQK52119.1 hypothetical protein [Myxococcota bacterium]
MRRVWLPLVALAWTLACGGGSGGSDIPACIGPACPDAVLPDAGPTDPGPGDPGQDPGRDTYVPPWDFGEETGDPCSESPRPFGCPCAQMTDCASGFCVLNPDNSRTCSQTCVENCPEGWVCQQTYIGGEPISVCMPYQDPLCHKACLDDGVCGLDTLCVRFETKQYCLQGCGDNRPCPENYDCQEVQNAAGTVTAKQCVPVSGHCDCPPDVDYQNDVNHCGTCETRCDFPNGVPFCDQGHCVLAGCLEGYIDLNGRPDDGCEYRCTFRSSDDRPDPDDVAAACQDDHCYDANCDGMDGVASKGVFVDAATGDDQDNFLGDRGHPFKTISAAIAFAASREDRRDVFVSRGQYREQVILAEGVNLYGGYDAAGNWQRNIERNKTQISWDGAEPSAVRAVVAMNIIGATDFDGFYVKAASASLSGSSSYGMYVYHCSGGLRIRNNTIEGGNGADGRGGRDGTYGLNGTNGGTGSNSFEYENCSFLCNVADYNANAVPGNGGTSPCGQNGGKGGRGGKSDQSGEAGVAGQVNGGAQGSAGGPQSRGGDGQPGRSGNSGSRGSGGAPGGGLNPSSLWVPANGQDGGDGEHGRGGGGGGGGGGDSGCSFGIFLCKSAGASGGGGGGGGCGGIGGKGGSGGGSSFGLFVLEASPVIERNVLASQNGGNGGYGGAGGEGGKGGQAGAGGSPVDDDGGAGGNGGKGGDGGRGGAGGGGAGGLTYPLYILGGSSSPQCSRNEYQVNGFPGAGGEGGDGLANKGADGSSGQIFGAVPTCLP